MHRLDVWGEYGHGWVHLRISLVSPSLLKQGFSKRSLDILDPRNTSSNTRRFSLKKTGVKVWNSFGWKRRLMILWEKIEEPLCRMRYIREQDISGRYAAILLTICSLARYDLFPRFFDKIFPSYAPFFLRSKYPQSSIANSYVVVETQCGSAHPLPREAQPSNGLKSWLKQGVGEDKERERGVSNPLWTIERLSGDLLPFRRDFERWPHVYPVLWIIQ